MFFIIAKMNLNNGKVFLLSILGFMNFHSNYLFRIHEYSEWQTPFFQINELS